MISVTELQRLGVGEALVLYDRQYPYKTGLLSREEYVQRRQDILSREKMLKRLDGQFEQLFEESTEV